MKKRYIFLLVSLALVILMLSGCNYSSYTDVRYYREEYYPGIRLELRNSVGDINIKNWSEDYIYIEARINGVSSDPLEAEKIVKSTHIDIENKENQLEIRGVHPDFSFGNSLGIEYNIRIPEEFNAEIITSTGDIGIEKIRGNFSVRTSTGRCEIGSMRGNLTARMGTDDLIIGYLKGKIDVGISTGKVRASLRLPVATFSSIRTSTGDIEVNLGRRATSKLTAITGSGDIYLNDIHFEKKIITNLGFGGKLNLISSTGDVVVKY